MSDPRPSLPRAHCERCKTLVDIEHRHPTLRKVAYAYLLLPLPFVPVLPIMAADYVVSLPLLMLYMLGLGRVFSIIRDPPTCVPCGAVIAKSGRLRA